MVEETQGDPRIALAIGGGDAQKRYRLGSVRVARDADRSVHWATGW